MKVAATYSIKGGVGKTTSAVNLAHEAARAGVRVLLWDIDPQGAATYFFRVKPRLRGGTKSMVRHPDGLDRHIHSTDVAGVDLVPADFSLRHLDLHLDHVDKPRRRLAELLAPLDSVFDLAIIDCPPSISLASESVFGATDALIVPVLPATLSARTIEQLVRFLQERPRPPQLLPHFAMVDRRKKLHRDLVETLPARRPEFLKAAIPNASAVERMGVERAPVGAFAPRSAAAEAFAELWREIATRLWSP
ncbi:MAG TPA: ParA family protein [Acidimicrobiales bacterium]|nr:ParA family protein [Acidimicrobiales bacterium]